ncbi:MAG: hypothetical protein ABL898_10460 [Hyphomicrobiaceae bacterium]
MKQLGVTLVALGLAASSALAQTMSTGDARFDFSNEALRPKTEVQKLLVESYLAAIAAKSTDALLALVHPVSRACITSDTGRAYQSQVHARDISRNIPSNARLIIQPFIDPLALTDKSTEFATLPISPSEILGIDYIWDQRNEKGVVVKNIGITILRMVAPHEGRLMLVDYCLTAKGEELFRQKQTGTVPAPNPTSPKQ